MQNFDIAISYRSEIPADIIDDFTNLISSPKLRLEVEERKELEIYAGFEWLILTATAVAVFIASSYFGGFFKEMGKEHYHLLKKSLKALAHRLLGPSGPKVFKITSGKVSEPGDYSLVFSIIADVGRRKKIRLLIQQDASQKECEDIIESFIDFIYDIYSNVADNELLEELEKGRGILLVAFNRHTKTIENVIM